MSTIKEVKVRCWSAICVNIVASRVLWRSHDKLQMKNTTMKKCVKVPNLYVVFCRSRYRYRSSRAVARSVPCANVVMSNRAKICADRAVFYKWLSEKQKRFSRSMQGRPWIWKRKGCNVGDSITWKAVKSYVKKSSWIFDWAEGAFVDSRTRRSKVRTVTNVKIVSS